MKILGLALLLLIVLVLVFSSAAGMERTSPAAKPGLPAVSASGEEAPLLHPLVPVQDQTRVLRRSRFGLSARIWSRSIRTGQGDVDMAASVKQRAAAPSIPGALISGSSPSRPLLPSSADIAAVGVQAGLIGAALGGIVGLGNGADSPDCPSDLPCNNNPGLRISGRRVATGAFLGWSLGSGVGTSLRNRHQGNTGLNFISTFVIGGLGVWAVKNTDEDAWYLPFAALQVVTSALIESGTRSPGDR